MKKIWETIERLNTMIIATTGIVLGLGDIITFLSNNWGILAQVKLNIPTIVFFVLFILCCFYVMWQGRRWATHLQDTKKQYIDYRKKSEYVYNKLGGIFKHEDSRKGIDPELEDAGEALYKLAPDIDLFDFIKLQQSLGAARCADCNKRLEGRVSRTNPKEGYFCPQCGKTITNAARYSFDVEACQALKAEIEDIMTEYKG